MPTNAGKRGHLVNYVSIAMLDSIVLWQGEVEVSQHRSVY
jgi:hypothetical protein